MFDWIRLKVRNAVLAGISDAVEYLEQRGTSGFDDAQQILEERLKLLPAPEDKPSKRSKAI